MPVFVHLDDEIQMEYGKLSPMPGGTDVPRNVRMYNVLEKKYFEEISSARVYLLPDWFEF